MISVCIATYNGARYIGEQLASILKQLSAEDEVVVSDDGSTDGTLDIVRSFNDRRIRIVDGPRRHSPTLNFEWALRNAKGEYIFLADQDDVWLPDKLKAATDMLRGYEGDEMRGGTTDVRLRSERREGYRQPSEHNKRVALPADARKTRTSL